VDEFKPLALGCLTAELASGQPLFPGETDVDQISLILEALGRVSEHHTVIIQNNAVLSQGVRFPR
jgi:cyclin-dependent kinase-like